MIPAGIAVAVLVGAATVAARHADPAEVSPVVPAGGWNAVWIASVAGGLAAYTIALLLRRRAPRVRTVLAIAVVVQALPLAGPLLLSKDVYLYWSEARLVLVRDANPYRATPDAFPGDPALPSVSEAWRAEPAPYGPAWEALALVPAAAAGTSPGHAQLGYRVLALAGVLAALGVLAGTVREPRRLALFGWNPLVALHFAGGGHSDGWIAALLVVAAVAAFRPVAGAAWPLASAFKPFPAVLVPLQLAAARARPPRRWWAALVATSALIVAASAAVWGLGWLQTSLVGVRGASPLGGVHWLSDAGLRHRYAVAVNALVFAATYCVLLVDAWRRRRARLALATVAFCLTSSLLRPWYGIWALALAAAEGERLGAVAAVALTWYLLLGDAVAL